MKTFIVILSNTDDEKIEHVGQNEFAAEDFVERYNNDSDLYSDASIQIWENGKHIATKSYVADENHPFCFQFERQFNVF